MHLTQILSSSVTAEVKQAEIVNGAACLCCRTHNETSTVLRELFMQALHKKIPPFQNVFLNCAVDIDPASIIYTVAQDFFLKERFQFEAIYLALDESLFSLLNNIQHVDVMVWCGDERLSADAQQQVEQLYQQLSVLKPSLKQAEWLNIKELSHTKLNEFRAIWQQRSRENKRHSSIFTPWVSE